MFKDITFAPSEEVTLMEAESETDVNLIFILLIISQHILFSLSNISIYLSIRIGVHVQDLYTPMQIYLPNFLRCSYFPLQMFQKYLHEVDMATTADSFFLAKSILLDILCLLVTPLLSDNSVIHSS